MPKDDFTEIVKRQFADFERKHGRVPTYQELANQLEELAKALGADPRVFTRKLKAAVASIGIDHHVEGTSAFKSTLREILSSELLLNGMPGFKELNLLLNESRSNHGKYSKLSWRIGRRDYHLSVSSDDQKGHAWFFSKPSGRVFARITNEIGDILALLESFSKNESIDPELITHMNGEPEPYVPTELPYQDPLPADQLPPNVLPFRKPYQHSDE